LAHSRHDLKNMSRWANAMRMNSVDADLASESQNRRRFRAELNELKRPAEQAALAAPSKPQA